MNVTYKILSPLEYSGSIYGDYGYEINGEKSKKGYLSRKGADSAMYRELEKRSK